MIGRLARVGSVALDARSAAHGHGAADRAAAAGWIAANVLAARGLRADEVDAQTEPCTFAIRAADLTSLLAAIAAHPALVDASTLPVRWRVALRLLGLPLLEEPAPAALAAGASVAVLARPMLAA